MVLKYTENSILWGYSYILLRISLRSFPSLRNAHYNRSVRPSTHISTYTHDTVRIFLTLDTEKLYRKQSSPVIIWL